MERAMRRDGARASEVRARLSRQMPLDEKRKYADFVIDTSGRKEETLRQTRAVYDALRRIAIMKMRDLFLAAVLVGGFL